MDLFARCLLLCVSSLLAGWAPLFVQAPSKRRWMATMGVGVLIGAAFVNVLPEAIHTTYLQPRSHTHHHHMQHARTTPNMHPSGVPATRSAASSPAAVSAWNPLPAFAGGSQSSSEEALHRFQVPRGGAATTPQSVSGSVTAARKLAANNNAQRQLLAADEPAAAAKDSHASHQGHDHAHDHSHAGHAHAHVEPVAPSRPAPVTSSRLVDDEAAIGSHLLRNMAATAVPSIDEPASVTAAEPDSAPAQQLLACFGEDHPSKYMGALLALGFVAMLLVDRCAGRHSTPAPSVSSDDDIESAPLLPAVAVARGSSHGQQEGVELMSRQKSSPGLASPALAAAGGGNGATSSSSSSGSSTSHGTTPRTKVGGGGSGSAHPTPVGGAGGAGSNAHLNFPSVHSIASAHSHGGGGGGGGGGGSHSHSPSAASLSSSPTSVSSGGSSSSSSRSGAAGGSASSPAHYNFASDVHVLLGVVVYALVDGLSLGTEALGSPPAVSVSSSAAAASSDSVLSLLLPRAPLAFGVSCFLMFQNRASPKTIQKLALLYAALTPLAAMATWTALASWPSENGSVGGQFDPLATPLGFGLLGLTKLFAAGALLFTVAVHILPEIQNQHGGGHGHGHGAPSAAAAAAVVAAAAGHGHGGDAVSPGGSASSVSSSLQVPAGLSVRGSSPSAASRHEEHPLLVVGSSHVGLASQAVQDDGKSMPWRYVVALICGLLTPLALACMHTPKIMR